MPFREFRWQFAALLVSLVVFSIVATFRFASILRPAPTPAATVTQIVQNPATPTRPASPIPSPLPTQASRIATVQPADNVITFREGVVGQIRRLNPLLADSNPAERDITTLIYEGLTTINEFGEPTGELAREWVTSRNGIEYVFTLRDDILWQDGTRFTADDVVFTYQLMAMDDFPGLANQRAFWQTVEIQKLNDTQIRFRLAQPLASFPSLLTGGIVPQHALDGITGAQLANHPFNVTPIGTGPYQLEAFRSDDNGQTITAVDLRLAPTYRQRPSAEIYQIERMRFRLYPSFTAAVTALDDGLIQGLATRRMSQRPDLQTIADTRLLTQIAPRLGVLIYNWDEGEDKRFFSDQRVRSALQLSLNTRTPVETMLLDQAVVADSPLQANSWAYNENIVWSETDIARARDLIDNTRIIIPDEETSGDALYAFSILVPADSPALGRIAQEIANQWAQLDLAVTVEAVARDAYQERLEGGDFETAIVELPFTADPDVYAYWHVGQYPDGRNYGGAADDRISEQLDRARREPNGLNRVTLYRQFQQTFISRSVALPLYYPLFTYAVADGVTGVQLGFIALPEDRFRTLADWRIGTN